MSAYTDTWLPKTEEILKITKLMSCMNFSITIQAAIKAFGKSTPSTDKNWGEFTQPVLLSLFYTVSYCKY